MHTDLLAKSRIYASLRAKARKDIFPKAESRVHATQKVSYWLVNYLLVKTLLEIIIVICHCPTSEHIVWGALHLDRLQELTHYVLIVIWGGRARLVGASLSGEL